MQLGFHKQAWRVLPALILGCVMWILWKGLWLDNNTHPSDPQMPFPEFALQDIRTKQTIRLEDLHGELHIIHVWASWCRVCVKEHEEWLDIKEKYPVSLIGMIYRDDPQKALIIIQKTGDPYAVLLNDEGGKLGISLGLRGTPETFVVSPEGVIRYHHAGALTAATFEKEILPVIEQINREQA